MTKHSIYGMERDKWGLQDQDSLPPVVSRLKVIAVAFYKSADNSEHGDTIVVLSESIKTSLLHEIKRHDYCTEATFI